MSKTIELSDFEYEQLLVILNEQKATIYASVTSQVGEAWIKKLVLKLKAAGEETSNE